jgi:hypothetical protein
MPIRRDLITIIFGANVDAQAGAYATGILAVMVSGAVTISAARRHHTRATAGCTVLTLILLYALGDNIIEKPDGILISVSSSPASSSCR